MQQKMTGPDGNGGWELVPEKKIFGRDLEKIQEKRCRRGEKKKKPRLSAYKDLTGGLLTREEFSDITSDLRKEEDQLTQRLQALADAPSPAADAESLCEEMQKLLQFTTLNKVQLQQFIKRITVDADRHVTIQFAFQEPHGKDQSSK